MVPFRYSITRAYLRYPGNMADLNKFGKEMTDFRNGILDYKYSFNSVGNLFFKTDGGMFNQSFLKIPVANFQYDVKKIGELHKLNFEEFTETAPTSVVEENPIISELERTVYELKNRLEISLDHSDRDKLISDILASKDLIIQMRISAGEGDSSADFSDEFPYFPEKDSLN